MRNVDVLLRINEQRNILHEIRKRKANWIGHILRRNCLLKQVIEGEIKGEMEVTRRWGRRRKKLLDDLKDRKGYSHLKEKALDRTMWRNRFGGGLELSLDRILNEWMNERCPKMNVFQMHIPHAHTHTPHTHTHTKDLISPFKYTFFKATQRTPEASSERRWESQGLWKDLSELVNNLTHASRYRHYRITAIHVLQGFISYEQNKIN